ncbi:NADH dehydrogenase [ubiquinone] 1 beta subcomplex subunit 3 [Trichogramma pretiosum]|uniref:NADH dehydrogenase [ubiquinone] 1 beta subcomplex subunit 3 n=1 Tax=Trichogramma pretiosum TaxID=7493 RepID=UPI0006C96932|nr:NADH dehydrogenase [ubiquinone] 1 beta subcomplex subunit 3 [Trichogramma pretiosum]
MGGHHHITPPPVPDYRIYKVEESPTYSKVQERLAKHGLKDPWARNYVWRCYLNKGIKRPHWVMFDFFTWGWKYWVPLLGIVIGAEQFLGIDYHGHAKQKHGHGHDHEHH